MIISIFFLILILILLLNLVLNSTPNNDIDIPLSKYHSLYDDSDLDYIAYHFFNPKHIPILYHRYTPNPNNYPIPILKCIIWCILILKIIFNIFSYGNPNFNPKFKHKNYPNPNLDIIFIYILISITTILLLAGIIIIYL